MTNTFSVFAAIIVAAGAAVPAAGGPIVITFDENPPINIGAKQIIDNEYDSPEWGNLVISANANFQAADFAVIFDSDYPTGNDPDLATPGANGNASAEQLHNLLIIQTNAGGLAAVGNQINNDPDDHSNGGTITMVWDVPIFDLNFHFVDMEKYEAPPTFIHFFTNPSDVVPYATVSFAAFDGVSGIDYGDNSVNYFSAADINTQLGGGPSYSRKVVFDLYGSGAIGSLGYTTVPEPGSMLLLGSGLLALAGWMRRRAARQR